MRKTFNRPYPWVTPQFQRLIELAETNGWTVETLEKEATFEFEKRKWRYLPFSKCFISVTSAETIRSIVQFQNGVVCRESNLEVPHG